ncbi:uncharacterized protein ACNLHF_018846 [Anomaloglossus baeobatrachus]|uniref:uncharacterized protein LOC142309850 n=1 Tax=Anomaloglossus baeobatrachus TaxID=238106 RepID=UPI003F500632
MLCHGALMLTLVVSLVSCFVKIPLVENLPIPLPNVDAEIPSVSSGIMDKIGLTALLRFLGLLPMSIPGINSIMAAKSSLPAFGFPDIPGKGRLPNEPQDGNNQISRLEAGGSPNELQDLNRRISRLEAVFKLEGKIQLVGDKMMATNGKEEDFATSNSTCKGLGGGIVTPMNEAENNAVLEFLKKYNRYAYMGIKQGPIPGVFNYLNGVPIVYTRWRKGEPSGKGTEGCVEMYTDGQWNDKACNQKRLTVCEL